MQKINLINGLLLINKPSGITSHDVVDIVRKELGIRRVGHGGTLDPLATGLLVLGLGKSTKRLVNISGSNKEYIFKLQLGIVTDTQDIEGKIISENKDFKIDPADFKNVVKLFVGNISQVPPMYSAKKQNGKRLYDLARKGIVVEREPVNIEITSLEILDFDGVFASLKMICSSGTYVRTICHDIGEKLGVGACMTELIRTNVGQYDLRDAIDIAGFRALSKQGKLERII